MDVEVKKPIFYRLLLIDGNTVEIHRDIIESFLTLNNMLTDLTSEDGTVPTDIQIFESITAPILQWAIDAYVIQRTSKPTPQTLKELYEKANDYNDVEKLQSPIARPLLTLFGDTNTLPSVAQLPLLFELIEVVSYLEAKALLVLTMDWVYELIKTMSSEALRELIVVNEKKRKEMEEEEKEDTGLLLTPYYKRERLVYAFMTQSLPYEIVRSVSYLNKYATPIACGTAHQLYLTRDGLYVAGSNEYNQLGLSDVENVRGRLAEATVPGKPLLIAANHIHNLCLTTEGLYGCGGDPRTIENPASVLGLGDRLANETEWSKIDVEGEVLLIETNMMHTFILTTTGLYSTGDNNNGRLGTGDKKNRTSFTKIEIPGDILDIKLAYSYSIVLTTKGLYGSGLIDRTPGGTGLISKSDTFVLLTDIVPSKNIMSIAAGDTHTLFTAKGFLYGSGSASSGAIGVLSTIGNIQKLDILPGESITSVYAKEKYSFVINALGELYGTGVNEYGQLGVGDTERRRVFTKTIGLEGDIKAVICGGVETYVLTTEGVFLAGRNQSRLLVKDGGNIVKREFIIFTKLAIDLGYSWPTTVSVTDEDQPREKRIKLQCEYCRGKARFIALSLPCCSKYCSYKAKFQQ